MIAKFRFISSAMEEVAEAIEHYNQASPRISDAFLSELDHVIQLLMDFPQTGTSVHDDFRSFPFRRYPFNVVYRIDSEELVVVAVTHQSRKPDYWRDRV